ncbi:glycosyltransferase family 4 protein [Leptospira idonii]|uniref:Glycosyltransferase family 1 protein n=1 Tax=Leptospira idonii TaxID=1193500 RepID=A0A4R9LVF8_9LEPT|nr:glycosyltransferase [Leptospira idonii]TGN17124.1 glycosyltransferase family 1 protein [Leptospira idonii]
MNVFQHLDELKDSDGVGNDALGLAAAFQTLGWKSNFITRIPRKGKHVPDTNFYPTSQQKLPLTPKDVHILHYGGQGYPFDFFQNLPGKKILRFHNITPANFYKTSTTPEIYQSMLRFESLSYLELATLSIFCDSVWCDSPFNAETIADLNFKNVSVLPICKSYRIHPHTEKEFNNGSICFVGRYSPQKKWEDLIEFFFHWKKKHPHSKLYCIGSVIGAFDGYFDLLKNKVNELRLEADVEFMTGLSDEEVLSVLKRSSAFVSMSEHEGFCLPILEAFGMNLPVFAFEQGAIRSTMREGGYLFRNKNYTALANEIESVFKDAKKIDQILNSQRSALSYYNEFPWVETLPKLVSLL